MQVPDAESFLRAFHAQLPGATSQIMARGSSDAGSSYALLATEVPLTTEPLSVLDLACGDGYLLGLLQQRAQPNLRLVGVDMSAQELQAARQRLGPDVVLLHEQAHQIPLPAASVDVVVCHMALMLLAPLDAVVAELRRILVPGGIFTATIGATTPQQANPVFAAFSTSIQELVQQTGRVPPDLGDARTHTLAGLQAVFNAASGFTQLSVQNLLLHLDGTPGEVAEFFTKSYNGFALGDARDSFAERMVAALEALADESGRVPFELPLAKLRCVRAGRASA